jgi:hypothetical protein
MREGQEYRPLIWFIYDYDNGSGGGGICVGALNEILTLHLLGVTECKPESNQQHQIQVHSVADTQVCLNMAVFNRPPCRAEVHAKLTPARSSAYSLTAALLWLRNENARSLR